jgi:type III secretion protein D
MYELRILSGLHRGATLPLDDNPLVIGASEDADVVLVDPGIEERHATLALNENGWLLSALDGVLRSFDSNQSESLIDLAEGDFARVGSVWLTVVEQGAAWENPPPEPVDQPASVAATDTAPDELDQATQSWQADVAEHSSDAGQIEAMADDAQSVEAGMAVAETDARTGQLPSAPAMRGPGRRRIIYASLVGVTVLSAAAAYALTSKPDPVMSAKAAALSAPGGTRSRPAGKGSDKTIAAAFDAANRNGAAEQTLSPEELRSAFRKRLSDADLLKRFDLTLQDESWSMQAALDDDEAARFERILTAFVKAHNIAFPVNAKVGNSESMLPFKIRQVISGVNASIVTQEGERLYIGDEYKGVRLVTIDSAVLTFAGKRKIQVKW